MTGFFMAWGMFCAIPCPHKVWDSDKYPHMLLAFPWIGLMIGALWALAGLAAAKLGFLGAALMAVLPGILSGFIHLDGFMDCADAVLSRRDLEKRRAILKDSHVGAFAVIAFGLWGLLGFAAFASLDVNRVLYVLPFIPAVCRGCSAAAVLSFAPMSTSGYAKLPESVKAHHKYLALLETMLFAAAAVLLGGVPGCAAVFGAIGSWAVIHALRRNLQGMSGDISGCAVTVGELCAVMALVVLS